MESVDPICFLQTLAELAPRLRAVGVLEVCIGGTSVRLSPMPPAVKAPPAIVDPEVAEADSEEEQEKAMRSAWDAQWGRLTRSSGAGIPPYPGRDAATRFLGKVAA